MGELDLADPKPSSNSLVRTGSFTTEDPCAHEQATAPWDNVVTPLSRGPYRQIVHFLASPGVTLYREHILIRTRLRGLSPPGVLGFAVPLRVGSDTSFWGAPLHEIGLPITMPDGVHADFSAGQQHLIALIDLGLFRQSVPRVLCDSIETAAAAANRHVVPATAAAVARLGATLNTLLDAAQTHPDTLCHPHAVRCMQQDVLAAFCGSLSLPSSPPRRVKGAIRQRGLNRAIEYLRSADTALVTVADLCTAASVNERTLQYAFRESFGLSPLGLLHLRRYHTARRDLLAADCRMSTVKEIAQYNGFYQMGRFAVRYKALFRESPSDTLRKPPTEFQRRLPGVEEMGLF
jgi:AraC-like DNA-binding protein